MTRMILTGLLALVLIAGLTVGKAMAAGSDSKPAVEKRAEQGPFAKLSLTDDQKAKAKEIMQQARKDAQVATDKAEKRKIMQAAREKIRDTVLTDAQREQLLEMRHPLLSKMGEKIGITDQQKQQIKDIWKQAAKDIQGATDKAAKQKIVRDAMKKIHDTVLTDDQRKKMEELRKNRPAGKHDKDAVKPATTT